MTAKICKSQRSDEDAIIGVASLHLEAIRKNGVFHIPPEHARLAQNAIKCPTAKDWHERFMHPAHQYLQPTSKAVKGMIMKPNTSAVHGTAKCENCILGKFHEHPFPASDREYTYAPGEYFTVDIVVATITGYDGSKYCIHFMDRGSELGLVFPAKTKDEIQKWIVWVISWSERQTGQKVKKFSMDKAYGLRKCSDRLEWNYT